MLNTSRTLLLLIFCISQVAVTRLRCGGKYDTSLVANLRLSPTVKEFLKSANISQSYVRISSGTIFVTHGVLILIACYTRTHDTKTIPCLMPIPTLKPFVNFWGRGAEWEVHRKNGELLPMTSRRDGKTSSYQCSVYIAFACPAQYWFPCLLALSQSSFLKPTTVYKGMGWYHGYTTNWNSINLIWE